MRVLCLSNMYPGRDDPDYGAFVATMCEALERAGAEVELAAIDVRGGGVLRTPAKYAGLTRRALPRARAADVVYVHYLFPTGAVARLCRAVGGAPFVVTAHGRDVRNLARPGVRRGTAAALSTAAGVIAVSRYLAGQLRASGLELPPVHVANMGVDLRRFLPQDRAAARARLRIAPRGPLVLAAGGLTDRKNPLTLLQAFARLRVRVPAARLAFVGDGPLAAAVDAGTERLGLAGHVIRTGALPHDEVGDWMAASDALALVSRVEPLGVVALEAMASGRPVVATRVGGAAEVVPDGRGGAIVDPDDPDDIASGLGAVLSDPPSAAACRRIAEAHGVDRQARRILGVLAGAAGRPEELDARAGEPR